MSKSKIMEDMDREIIGRDGFDDLEEGRIERNVNGCKNNINEGRK